MTARGPRFEFVLVNRTKLPLTLNRIVVLTSSADALDVPLGDKPLAPDGEHPQLFDLIQTDVVGDWADGKRVEMDVIAAIYFTDAFGDRQRQLAGRYFVRQARGEAFLSRYQQGVSYPWSRARARHPEIDTGDIQDRLSEQ